MLLSSIRQNLHPPQWVTVRRIRIKDAVEYVWWLSKLHRAETTTIAMLKPYGKDMERLTDAGYTHTLRAQH